MDEDESQPAPGSTISGLVGMAGCLLILAWGFVGTVVCFNVIADAFGFVIAILGVLVFDIILVIAPFYALFVDGNWVPLLVVFGGGILVNGTAALLRTLENG